MSTKKLGIAEIEKQYGPLTFGRLLKSHRVGEGLLQIEMAKKLGLSKQSLNDIENGRKIPSIRRAVQIGKKLGLLQELIVELVLQDQVDREHLKVRVTVSSGSRRAS
jgi:DNA-binding XRE family transcriptional regulator